MNSNFMLLYVESPEASTAFYERLLEKKPVKVFPNFVLFELEAGFRLALLARATVTPPDELPGRSSEVVFVVSSSDEVEHARRTWGDKGVRILVEPHEKPFGRTFVAEDLDGHRLRVCSPYL